jgi:hypothetical protein
MEANELEILSSPQAKFLKNVYQKDHPELSDAEVDKLVVEKLRPEDGDEHFCAACGS